MVAATAGLVHDLGKLALRAGAAPRQLWNDQTQSEYGYKHALLSSEIAVDLLPNELVQSAWAAGRHHKPNDRLSRVVAVADRLSAGERAPSDSAEPQRLLSPFHGIALSDAPAPPRCYTSLEPLAASRDALMPVPSINPQDDRGAYASLWEGFQREAKVAKKAADEAHGSPAVWMQNMLALSERWLWCVPSAAYGSIPDVSLHDHNRMTAALAACLVQMSDARVGEILGAPGSYSEPIALLVGGDLSGIQDFIYTITPRGAAAALRGRSMHLQLLTDAVVHYLLRSLGLPPTNLVYASGGHFYLLTPPASAERLPELQRYVSRVFLRHHTGDLYVAMAWETLDGGDFYKGRMARKWQDLSRALGRAKEHRYRELGADMYELVFAPGDERGRAELECQVCHREHPETRLQDGVRRCPACEAYDALGDELRTARWLVLTETDPVLDADEGPYGGPHAALNALGLRAVLTSDLREIPSVGDDGSQRVLALDDEALAQIAPGPRRAIGRKLLVNVTPRHGRAIATTEEMAKAARGIERLGVLRMDVDDLGLTFERGLGKRASLSRMATLSLAVSLFFEGLVESLAQSQNTPDRPDRVYSIYSGGDDLFFVGAWDAVMALALDIVEAFGEYTGGHADMHLSGGCVLVHDSYPLYRAAEEAREAEEQAKARPGKNALTFLGRTAAWETVRHMAAWSKRLEDLITECDVAMDLLRVLANAQRSFEARARLAAERGTGSMDHVYGPWIPRLRYRLARMTGRYSHARDELEELQEILSKGASQSIAWLGTAARWAELSLRKRADH